MLDDDELDIAAMGPHLSRIHRDLLLRGACSDLSLAPELRRNAWRAVSLIDRLYGIDSDSIAMELHGTGDV